MTLSDKISHLAKLIEARYRTTNNPHPELAAKFQMELVMKTIKGQEQYAEQLIDEEIAAETKH